MISHIIHVLLTARKTYIVNIRGLRIIVLRGSFRPELSYSTYLTILGILKLFKNNRKLLKVCEIGSGTGIIGLLTARIFKAYVVCTDVSNIAILNTKLNIKLLGIEDIVDIVQTSSASAIRSSVFDITVTNPPYLPCDNYVEICAKSSMNVLKDILVNSFRIVKEGGYVLYTVSSLAPIILDRVINSVKTPIDIIYLVLCRRS